MPGQALSKLAGPIGINMLLGYLQAEGVGYNVRPWVWIIAIVAGPLFTNAFFQLYIYLSVSCSTRLSGLPTDAFRPRRARSCVWRVSSHLSFSITPFASA